MAEKKYIIDNAELMAEWDWEKNKVLGFDPHKISYGSAKKVWWKCQKGHEWEISPNHRSSGNGCPYCAGQKILKGQNDLQTLNPDLANEWNYEKNNGLTPIDVMSNSGKIVWWKCSKGHEWQSKIQNRNRGNGCPYCSGRYAVEGDSDLQTVNPSLAKEWNYEKNDGLTPIDVKPNSDKKVWWKCNKGHEWQATIKHRSNGQNCPICNSERHTSLPEYALVYYLKKYGVEVLQSYKEQGYELDVYIPAKRIAIEYDGSYWHRNKTEMDLEKNSKCKKDEIKLYRIREGLPSLNDTSIDHLIQDNKKDLSKALKEILREIIQTNVDIDLDRDAIAIDNLREYTEKESSLLFSNPTLAEEWNYEKNGNPTPQHFTANSGKKVWWKCQKGHEWKSIIYHRNKGIGCPYCAGRKVLKGENDLQTLNPILSKEWNCEKNNGLTPSNVMPNSNKKVWWKCSQGHEWQAVIGSRNSGCGCPYCAGQKVIKGNNDLQTLNPDLAKEWNYEKNAVLAPVDVMSNSGKKVWWKCSKGHEWESTISNRNNGRGCPYCAGKKVLKGYNDLQTANPTLANEWNYERNNSLTPSEVTPNSNKKVWWKCNQGHEWQATIGNRNIGRGCPECAKQKRKKKDI